MLNIVFLFLSFFHPFYVSVTEINHNAKNKTLEVSVKIFFDDLEAHIQKENSLSFDIIQPTDKAKTNQLIAAYLQKHLRLSINNKSVSLKYLGYEIQEDAAWCYLEIANINKISTLSINNNILYDLHKEQVNMLNVTVNQKRQSYKLDAPKSSISFKF